MKRKRIGIYEAKSSLSKLLREVKERGAFFEITERGKAIAIMGPMPTEHSLEKRIQELVRLGVISSSDQTGVPKQLAKKKGALARFLAERE